MGTRTKILLHFSRNFLSAKIDISVEKYYFFIPGVIIFRCHVISYKILELLLSGIYNISSAKYVL